MTWRTDKTRLLVWGVVFLVSTILTIVGNIAWGDHTQIASNTQAIERHDERTDLMLEMQRETRQDVKDIKNHLLERK